MHGELLGPAILVARRDCMLGAMLSAMLDAVHREFVGC